MPVLRRRGLRDDEITNTLYSLNLDDSDVDGFEDDDDYERNNQNDNQEDASDSSETETESPDTDAEDQVNSARNLVRGRGRGRGRGRRGDRRSVNRNQFNNNVSWSPKSFQPNIVPFIEPAYLPVNSTCFNDKFGVPFIEPAYLPVNSTCFNDKFGYYEQYINSDLIDVIVDNSNRMYVLKTGRSLGLTKNETYVYIGICMVMSCIQYPRLRMYWEIKYRVPVIADHMSRNRFFQLRNSLKLVYDSDISADNKSKDKLWKVRPILDAVANGCRKQVKNKYISVDEMMIPFSGTCGLKQHCPGKPYPTGLKAFVLANPEGIVCDFHVYQGTTTYPDYEDSGFGLGEKVVLKLTENLVPGHVVYFDRYFTSIKLAQALLSRGLMCAGTLMKNRIPRDIKSLLKEDRILKREGRGTSQVLVHAGDDLAVTKWLDNKGVVFLSSIHANETSDTCQRWCKTTRTYIDVNRPEVVKQYNLNMGGVDLVDRFLSYCPYRYRTKKWTQRVISHMIDLSVCNSWSQYRQDQLAAGIPRKKIQQLPGFKLDLGEALIENHFDQSSSSSDSDDDDDLVTPPPKKRGRVFVVQTPSSAKRKKKASHLPNVENIQQKCRFSGCGKKTTIRCTKCNIHLCLLKDRNCYKNFHS